MVKADLDKHMKPLTPTTRNALEQKLGKHILNMLRASDLICQMGGDVADKAVDVYRRSLCEVSCDEMAKSVLSFFEEEHKARLRKVASKVPTWFRESTHNAAHTLVMSCKVDDELATELAFLKHEHDMKVNLALAMEVMREDLAQSTIVKEGIVKVETAYSEFASAKRLRPTSAEIPKWEKLIKGVLNTVMDKWLDKCDSSRKALDKLLPGGWRDATKKASGTPIPTFMRLFFARKVTEPIIAQEKNLRRKMADVDGKAVLETLLSPALKAKMGEIMEAVREKATRYIMSMEALNLILFTWKGADVTSHKKVADKAASLIL